MYFRNSLLTFAAYLVSIIAVGLVLFTTWEGIKGGFSRVDEYQEEAKDTLAAATIRPEAGTKPPSRKQSVKTARRLRKLLDERTQLYRKQKNQLLARVDEHDKLRREYDRLFTAHQDLLKEYNRLWNEADTSLLVLSNLLEQDHENDDPAQANSNTSGQPDSLSIDGTPGANDVDGNLDLAIAEWELEQTRRQVAELGTLAARESTLSNASSMALIEIGAPAVPFLVEMLSDSQADVRSWAVWVLGHIGADAAMAMEEIEALTLDRNAEVARSAVEALQRIRSDI